MMKKFSIIDKCLSEPLAAWTEEVTNYNVTENPLFEQLCKSNEFK